MLQHELLTIPVEYIGVIAQAVNTGLQPAQYILKVYLKKDKNGKEWPNTEVLLLN